jgi:hypothetical protein
MAIQQVRLAQKPEEEGSLLERLVGAAYANELRRKADEAEKAGRLRDRGRGAAAAGELTARAA